MYEWLITIQSLPPVRMLSQGLGFEAFPFETLLIREFETILYTDDGLRYGYFSSWLCIRQ